MKILSQWPQIVQGYDIGTEGFRMRVSRKDIFYLLHKCYDAVNERKQKNDSIYNRKIPSAASITRT